MPSRSCSTSVSLNITDNNSIQHVHTHLLDTIGQTPLLSLDRLFTAYPFSVFGKMEAFNPGGSIKDRTAASILEDAWQQGALKRGDRVIESSSGNMALGLAQACLLYGLQLTVVVDPKLNRQTKQLLEVYGADTEYVSHPLKNGGWLGARLERVQVLLKRYPNSFWTNQYGNPANPKAHEKTVAEIVKALNRQLDYLFVATSTCGTLAGCAAYLKKEGLTTKLIGVDAVGSVIFGQKPAKRLIPGHGAGRPSQFLKPGMAHDVVHITDQECIAGCYDLLYSEAVLSGGSAGGIISAVKKYASQIIEGSKVAVLLCDRGERYLDTIYNKEWLADNFPHLYAQEYAA